MDPVYGFPILAHKALYYPQNHCATHWVLATGFVTVFRNDLDIWDLKV